MIRLMLALSPFWLSRLTSTSVLFLFFVTHFSMALHMPAAYSLRDQRLREMRTRSLRLLLNRAEPEQSLWLLTVPSSLWPQGGGTGPFHCLRAREGGVAGPTGASPLLLCAAPAFSRCPLGLCPGPYFPYPSPSWPSQIK